MENCIVPVNISDHAFSKRRVTGGQENPKPAKRLCSRKDQPQVKCQHRVATVSHPEKRSRSPASRPLRRCPRSSAMSSTPPSPQLCSANDLELHSCDKLLKIFNYSAEEYKSIYHFLVDGMIRSKKGRPRPYSLELGRKIKHQLWERMHRPTVRSAEGQNGRMTFEVVYRQEETPPAYDVDVSGEPAPGKRRGEQ